MGDTNIYNVWILQFKKDGTELLKAVFADRNSITAVPGSGTDYSQLLIQLTKDDMRFKNETSEFYIIVNAEDECDGGYPPVYLVMMVPVVFLRPFL